VPHRPTSAQTLLKAHSGGVGWGADFFTTEVWTWQGPGHLRDVFVTEDYARDSLGLNRLEIRDDVLDARIRGLERAERHR
jgi:hypothetical protein